MLPGELMLVQGTTGPHSHGNNAVKAPSNGITLVWALYKYTLLFITIIILALSQSCMMEILLIS